MRLGAVRRPARVNLFCALLLTPTFSVDDVETHLQQQFGSIILRSEPFPFIHTTYYDREMGAGLLRRYIAFEPLIAMTELPQIKHITNRLEAQWTTPSGKRRVNLDPGYLDLAKVVLASTKDHAHRLYIGAGIYAEITLRYVNRQFQSWEWTYPDYRLAVTQAFFAHLRELYKAKLRLTPPKSHIS